MSEQTLFERDLAAWMTVETSGGMPERAVIEAIEATRRVRPDPAWLARLRQPALRWERQLAVGTAPGRLVLVAIVALLVLAAVALVAVGWRPFAPPTSADWNGYRGGPDRAGIGGDGPVGRPVLQWRFAAGDSVKDGLAIAGDLVVVPGQDGVIHAIGLADGAERWRFAPGTSVTTPYIDGGLVFVSDGRGRVHALQLASGAEQWVSSEVLDSATSPTAVDGLVIIGTGRGDLAALDARTGDRRWRLILSRVAVRDPAAAPGTIYVGTADGIFSALRTSDGSVLWSKDFRGDPLGAPTVAAGLVFSGSRSDEPGGRLRALDAATGDVIWQTDEPWFAPAVSNGLAVSGRDDGFLVARDVRTGAERWRFVAGGGSIRGPAIYGSTVVFGADQDRWIGAVDLASGGFLWRYDIDGSNQCCVAVAKGYVVVGTMSGSVYVVGGDGSTLRPGSPPATNPPPTRPASLPASPGPSNELPEPYLIAERLGRDVTGIAEPLGMAIAPSGDLYVTDTSMQVTRIAPDDQIERWGRPGSGKGEFDFIPAAASGNRHGSIAVGPDGIVYVSDSDNHRIQVFTGNGDFVRMFGSLGSEPGQFTIPFDLGVDAQGNVFVVDDGLMRLTKFDRSGQPVWIVDGTTDPRLVGHLHTPRIDERGRITVINDDLGLIVVLDSDGSVIDSFEAPGCGVAIDPSGRFHVTECLGTTRVYDATHVVVAMTRDMNLVTVEVGASGQIVGLERGGDVIRFTTALPAISSQP